MENKERRSAIKSESTWPKILVIPSYYEIHVYEATEEEVTKYYSAYSGVSGLLKNGNVFKNVAHLFVDLNKCGFDDSIIWDERLRDEVEMLYDRGQIYIGHQTLYNHETPQAIQLQKN